MRVDIVGFSRARLTRWAALFLAAAAIVAGPAYAQIGISTVTVGQSPGAIAINAVTNQIYVGSLYYLSTSGTVYGIDGATNRATPITSGYSALGPLVVDPVGNRVYFGNFSGSVTVVDGATNAVSTTAPGPSPAGMALDPVTNQIYVSYSDVSDLLDVIDGSTASAVAFPTAVAYGTVGVNPATNKIYVGAFGGTMTVIDGATNGTTVLNTGITNQFAFAINSRTNTIFVPINTGGGVAFVDGTTGAVSYTVNTFDPIQVAVDEVTNTIYTTDSDHNAVAIINGSTKAVSFVTVGSLPGALAVDPATDLVYIANSGGNSVTILDGSSGTTTTIMDPNAIGPGAIAINPKTHLVYIANVTSGNVTVFDGSVHFLVTVPQGSAPGAILFATAEAYDVFGNPVHGYNGSLQVTSSDPAAALPAPLAVVNGTVTFAVTLNTLGNQTITVADAASPTMSGVSSPIVVSAAPTITTEPITQSVPAGATATFTAAATGNPPPAFQWTFNGTAIAGATGASYSLVNAQVSNSGAYAVVAANALGSTVSQSAFLTVNAATGNPSIAAQPQSFTIYAGGTTVLSVDSAAAPAPAGTTYKWYDDGVALGDEGGVSGPQTATLVLSGAAVSPGSYACIVSNAQGSVLSHSAVLAVVPTSDPGRLVNISTRASVGTGADILIAGFVSGGAGTSGSLPVLIRGIGPALTAFGVPGALADPVLTLFQGSSPIGTDTGWAGSALISSADSAVGAFALSNPASTDSALFVSNLPPGAYTAQAVGASGDTGVGLIEVYDASAAGPALPHPPRLVNLSARALVGTGANIVIAGFVVGGSTSKTVLIRASGPALASFGLGGTLADPALQLFSGSMPLTSNTGWKGNPQVAAAAAAVGAFSWGTAATADSALLITLPPGAYTAQVAGAAGDTGLALIEIYAVP